MARQDRGYEAEEQCAEPSEAGAQREHAPVDCARQPQQHAAARRRQERDPVAQPARDDKPTGCRDDREDDPFRHQLPDEPHPAGADRHADRHFLLTRQRPHEQQVADVGAGDEQHGDDHAERDGEGRQHRTGIVEGRLPQRIQLDAAAAVCLRIGALESAGDRRQFGLFLVDRDAGLQPYEAFDPARAAILELVHAGIKLRLHRRGHPELEPVADEGAVETLRRHADNGVRHAGEHLCFANDGRIAVKALLPDLIADDRHGMRVAADVLACLEASSENGMHADRVEIIRRHHAAERTLRAIADTECRAGDLIGDEGIGQRAVPFEILEVGPRHIVTAQPCGTAVRTSHRDQSILIDHERKGT